MPVNFLILGVKYYGMLFTARIHRFFFLLGLVISLCALPYSPFALSVGLITLAVNWLLDGLWVVKFNRFSQRKALWAFLLIYASMVVGFFYSEDLKYAVKELKLWLPMLFVPVILATSDPLKRRELKFLLIMFCTAVFVATLISVSIFIRDYSHLGYSVRYISPYISHIRFALMINLSIFLLGYLAFQRGYFNSILVKTALIFVAIWLVVFLFILQSLMGIVVLVTIPAILLIRWCFLLKEPVMKFSVIVGLVLLLLSSFSYLAHIVDKNFTRNRVDFKTLPKKTINGNEYTHDTISRQYENGNLVWINICYPELKRGWAGVSNLPLSGTNRDGQAIDFTLIRYLASKGLTKDSVGFSKLDSVDISLVKSSVTSVIYRDHKVGIYPRLYQILSEIDNYATRGVISGSTLMQRFVYLKASWQIIKRNILFGVGTGDGKNSLLEYYQKSGVDLEPKYWFLSHNQYLTVWIASGLIGLVMFLVGLLYPFFFEQKGRYALCLVFQLIILLSMLSEDTFETHVGISFAAIFYSLLFFGYDFLQDKSE